MAVSKEEIANYVNRNCQRASCFVCKEADKYENYTQCPYLQLKQLARERRVTTKDIADEFVNSL